MPGAEETRSEVQAWDFFDESEPDDEFGHIEIVRTLAEVARSVKPPFCIGLVGEWGVGKSFVLRRLGAALKDTLPVFYFDAWKYGGESVKRSLLDVIFHDKKIELDEKKKEVWLTRLYRSQVVPTKPVVGTTLGLLNWHLLMPVVLSAATYSVIKFVLRYDAATAFGSGALLGVLALAAQVMNNAFQVAWRTLSVPAIASPEEFEVIFGEILTDVLSSQSKSAQGRNRINPGKGQTQSTGGVPAALGQSSEGRAVILIDELDRCPPESRNEVLQGLRTYLQDSRCVYVVACAPKSLAMAKQSPSANELPDEEFLRKLFNLTCWIDSPGEGNLRRYAATCMDKVGIKTNSRDMVQILALGHTRNPRRIKHFLNTLNLAFRIARARQDKGATEMQTVTGNVAYLAKVLLIRQEWPQEFEEILDEPRKLRHWSEVATPSPIQDGTPASEIERARRIDVLSDFLRKTSLINADDPVPFLAITVGITMESFKPVESLVKALGEYDVAGARVVVESMRAEHNIWSKTIFDTLRSYRRTRDDQYLLNGIIVACALFDLVPRGDRQVYAKEIANLVPDSKDGFGPRTAPYVIPAALALNRRDGLPILNKYLSGLVTDGRINKEIAEALERNADALPEWAKNELNKQLDAQVNEFAGRQPDDPRVLRGLKEWPQNEQVVDKLLDGAIADALFLRYSNQAPGVVKELTDVLIRTGPAWAKDDVIAAKVRSLALEPLGETPSTGAGPSEERAVVLLEFLRELGELNLIDAQAVMADLSAYFSRVQSAADVVVNAAASVALSLARAKTGPPPDELSEPSEELQEIMDNVRRVSASTGGPAPLASYLVEKRLGTAQSNLAIYILWLIREKKYRLEPDAGVVTLTSPALFNELLKALFHLDTFSENVGSLPNVIDALRLFLRQHPNRVDLSDDALRGCLQVGAMEGRRKLNGIALLVRGLSDLVGLQQFSDYGGFLTAATKVLVAGMPGPDDIGYPEAWSALSNIFDFGDAAVRAELATQYSEALQILAAQPGDRSDMLRLIPRLWPYFDKSQKQSVLIALARLEGERVSRDLSVELESSWEYIRTAITDGEEFLTLAANLIRYGRADRANTPAARVAAWRLLRDRVASDSLVAELLEPSLPEAEIESSLRKAVRTDRVK
jgi:hypothetical protein